MLDLFYYIFGASCDFVQQQTAHSPFKKLSSHKVKAYKTTIHRKFIFNPVLKPNIVAALVSRVGVVLLELILQRATYSECIKHRLRHYILFN
jgi:hypothetical protein